MKKPGETCKLAYRWEGDTAYGPRLGDVLETSTGRRYIILEALGVRSMKLKVLVMRKGDAPPPDSRTYEFKWDKREKK